MAARLTNWAGNVEFSARHMHRPESLDRLRELVASGARVRALGSGHSFNRIADTPGTLIRLDRLPPAVEVDAAAGTVRVGAGTTFAELCAVLRRHGVALANLPSTPHFTVAGACATGTHGSGNGNPTLAAAVRGVELVTADGGTAVVERGAAEFDGAVTSLGALGVVTALTLDVVPGYEVEQYVYEDLPWQVLTERFEELFGAAYSVSAFTDWTAGVRLWVKRRTADPRPDLAGTGARPADGPRHPVPGMPVANATEQSGVPGPWDERLPHFRAGFVPSVGAELQSEYFVARADAGEAVKALRELGPVVSPVLLVSEIRTVAADACWLSPSHGRDSVAFHFTWVPDVAAVEPVLERIEQALAPFGPRPHWGKLSRTAPGALAASYARWEDFRELVRRFDPEGKFRNDLTEQWFGA
ncbi:alditol oxidase [Streptomyces capparidis]